MKGPMSPRVFSTRSRKVETFLLFLKGLPDKSSSVKDNSLYSHRRGGVEGTNMSFSTEKQETESGRGRLSGCIPPQVNINSLS